MGNKPNENPVGKMQFDKQNIVNAVTEMLFNKF